MLSSAFCTQDQAPLQNRAPDWQLGSKGCYDAATLAALQSTLAENLEAVADGNAEGCLSLPLPEGTMRLLKQVTQAPACSREPLSASAPVVTMKSQIYPFYVLFAGVYREVLDMLPLT